MPIKGDINGLILPIEFHLNRTTVGSYIAKEKYKLSLTTATSK